LLDTRDRRIKTELLNSRDSQNGKIRNIGKGTVLKWGTVIKITILKVKDRRRWKSNYLHG
jgi:hypothetical protein